MVSHLPKGKQAAWRRLQAAYERPAYTEAKRAQLALPKELKLLNESAAHSLEEDLEETLTLHRLGLLPQLGVCLETTTCIESLLSQGEHYSAEATRWRNSRQKQRWFAAALLDTELMLQRKSSLAVHKVFNDFSFCRVGPTECVAKLLH